MTFRTYRGAASCWLCKPVASATLRSGLSRSALPGFDALEMIFVLALHVLEAGEQDLSLSGGQTERA